ncbi:flavodoxin [Phocaeicola barnesiae]|uniref:flavodoxin n=1 Tax=Phocaeicola barnesiae TaxID=376804 RepID=UPI00266E9335|nr:flavodoxin [Phocaeicola barnesiae]
MKKFFYILLVAGLFFGFSSCEGDEPTTDQPQTEIPEDGGDDNGDDNGNNDSENPNPVEGDVLVVYYSFTNNIHTIVTDLLTQIEADVVRIEPAEKGLDYAANNYALGSALVAAIRENPDDASSYPAIEPVEVKLENYSTVIVAAPLWWSNMAAPLQTFLFNHGSEMADKNIGLIVSSASSGISGVEADAKRLIPDGNFLTPSLWIRSSQTSNCHALTAEWLENIGLIK